ncbi:hypothetical protein AVEN_236973-1, partial [Araneus ventricosus]
PYLGVNPKVKKRPSRRKQKFYLLPLQLVHWTALPCVLEASCNVSESSTHTRYRPSNQRSKSRLPWLRERSFVLPSALSDP